MKYNYKSISSNMEITEVQLGDYYTISPNFTLSTRNIFTYNFNETNNATNIFGISVSKHNVTGITLTGQFDRFQVNGGGADLYTTTEAEYIPCFISLLQCCLHEVMLIIFNPGQNFTCTVEMNTHLFPIKRDGIVDCFIKNNLLGTRYAMIGRLSPADTSDYYDRLQAAKEYLQPYRQQVILM